MRKGKQSTAVARTGDSNIRIDAVTHVGTADFVPTFRETLEENLEELNTLLVKCTALTAFVNWQVGMFAVRMLQDAHKKYGTRIVPEIAKRVRRRENWVYTCIHFYEAFRDEDVCALLEQHNKLEYWHLAALSRIKDEEVRGKLLTAAQKESMTVEAVKQKVRETLGAKPRKEKAAKGAGAKLKSPLSTLGKIESCVRRTTTKMAAELGPLPTVATVLRKESLEEEQRQQAENKIEELRQVLQDANNDINAGLQVLDSKQTQSGLAWFRKLRDLLKGFGEEIKKIAPQLETEMFRMGEYQETDPEYQKTLAMFGQASTYASRLRALCDTIMSSYHDMGS